MLRVIDAGFFTTIQDAGRRGFMQYGVPVSGPMDWLSFTAANYLVGNLGNEPSLEIGMSGCKLLIEQSQALAVVGAGFDLYLDHLQIPLGISFYGRSGQRIELRGKRSGGWVYLAANGGFQIPSVLNSSATYPRGGLGGLRGGRILDGDLLPVAKSNEYSYFLAGRFIDSNLIPHFHRNPIIRVIPGPQFENFTAESQCDLFHTPYQVTVQSDRMGYRLSGKKLELAERRELLSEGMAPGSIQVPPDGQPIVMMSDSPTSGGYPKIGTVISADLPFIAQAEPGLSHLNFQPVGVEEAQMILRALKSKLLNGIRTDEDMGVFTW